MDNTEANERYAAEQTKKFMHAAIEMLFDDVAYSKRFALLNKGEHSALIGALVASQALVFLDAMNYAERHR